LRQEVWVWSGVEDQAMIGSRVRVQAEWAARPYEYRNGSRSLVWLGRVTSRRHLDLEAARASRIVLQTGSQKLKARFSKFQGGTDSSGRYGCDIAIAIAIVLGIELSNLGCSPRPLAALSESASQYSSSPAPMVEGTTLRSLCVPFAPFHRSPHTWGGEKTVEM
jgi:hypothetical protein